MVRILACLPAALVLASAAGPAVSSAPSWVEAIAEAMREDAPLTAWQQGFVDGQWVKRPLGPEEFRAALALEFERLQHIEPDADGEPAMLPLVGMGYEPLPLPRKGCPPVETRFFLSGGHSGQAPPSAIEFRQSLPGPPLLLKYCPGPLGGLPTDLYNGPSLHFEVAINMSLPLKTCSTCAVSSAQVWSDGTIGTTHVNDFGYALHRGSGVAGSLGGCFFSFCLEWGGFHGSGAGVELFEEEPLEVPSEVIRHVP
jgi:hypothetical protein